jgi:deoxyribonuclease-1-like protein
MGLSLSALPHISHFGQLAWNQTSLLANLRWFLQSKEPEMAKRVVLVLLVAAVAGGGYFYSNYEIRSHYENGSLVAVTIAPRSTQQGAYTPWQAAESSPAGPLRPTIRIASMSLGRFDEHSLANHQVTDVLLRVLPRFDLIALQGFQGQTEAAVVRLAEQLSRATGRLFRHAACLVGRRDAVGEYSAFLFDQAVIEIDRSTLRLAQDPAGRFRHPPLVAAFRVRGPAEAEAFTCTLINVHTDAENATVELDLLRDVYKMVRNDGRNEDDVIVLGDFEADENHLGQLGQVLDLTAAITSMPTTVRGTRRADNILLDRRATVEYTGRAEVVDVLRECELTIEGAMQVSEHLPVWAEFSSYEGGQAGHLTATAAPAVR